MRPILSKVYVQQLPDSEGHYRPLLVASSGGGGHLSAIRGLIHYFESHPELNIIPTAEDHRVYDDRSVTAASSSKRALEVALKLQWEWGYFSSGVRRLLKHTRLPVFPDRRSLSAEIQRLKERKPTEALYVDTLLDCLGEEGFVSVAIYNVLARRDEAETLKKLIDFQGYSDGLNEDKIKLYFWAKLKRAYEEGRPYTEIVSTQVMSLRGLAKAVLMYNQWLVAKKKSAPPVVVQQYFTDLPSSQAVHLFPHLNAMNKAEKGVFCLYARGFSDEILQEQLPDVDDFHAIYDIPESDNPMVRSGFYDKDLHQHQKWYGDTAITHRVAFEDDEETVVTRNILKGEKVASIMLGSQASDVMVDYVKPLLENDFKHIYLFCGGNTKIKKLVNAFIEKSYPELERSDIRDRIICLGMQGDKEITPIFTRANVLVMRGGGLSVMEQMALPHNIEQLICVHQTEGVTQAVGAGTVWEDGNVDLLRDFLDERGVNVERVTSQSFSVLLDGLYCREVGRAISPLLKKHPIFSALQEAEHERELDTETLTSSFNATSC